MVRRTAIILSCRHAVPVGLQTEFAQQRGANSSSAAAAAPHRTDAAARSEQTQPPPKPARRPRVRTRKRSRRPPTPSAWTAATSDTPPRPARCRSAPRTARSRRGCSSWPTRGTARTRRRGRSPFCTTAAPAAATVWLHMGSFAPEARADGGRRISARAAVSPRRQRELADRRHRPRVRRRDLDRLQPHGARRQLGAVPRPAGRPARVRRFHQRVPEDRTAAGRRRSF